MVISYEASASDIARIRLTPSPIGEAVSSLRALACQGTSKHLGPFLDHARSRLRDVDTRLLRSLVPGTGYVPDVLTPAPGFAPSFRAQLEEMRATPPEEFAAQVAWMERDPGTTREWKARTVATRGFAAQHPERALSLVADQLEQFWRAVLDPIWERLMRSLDQDIHDRTLLAERGGTAAMLSSINERVNWDGATLSVRSKYEFSTALGGAGIVFVPSLFSQSEVLTMLPPLEPMLVYPRNLTRDFWSDESRVADPLSNLLGRGRAAVVHSLRGTQTTGELAARVGVTPGAISQHLAVLRECGLVVTEKRGRNSVHALTRAGEDLVSAAAAPVFSRRIL